MNKILLSIGVIALAIVSGCSKNDSAPSNSALTMFVNGCTGTSTASVKVNSKNISAGNISFNSNSGYQYITAGTGTNIAYYLPDGTPLVNQSNTVTVNAHYTAFAGGIITNPFITFVQDDMSAPSAGNAKIRFVNLSPDTRSFTASTQTVTFGTAISQGVASAYTEVEAGSANISAIDNADFTTTAFINSQQLSAGKIYTVMITGTKASSGGASTLKLTVINNN